MGEIFPLSVRGQATAVATLINFGSNFGVCARCLALTSSTAAMGGRRNTAMSFAMLLHMCEVCAGSCSIHTQTAAGGHLDTAI